MTADTIVTEFIATLKKYSLYDQLPEIVAALQEEVYRNQDISVISAVPLSSKEEEALRALLIKKWGEHTIVQSVDPVLLSGLVVKFQDRIIDTSGKQALRDLKQQLTA